MARAAIIRSSQARAESPRASLSELRRLVVGPETQRLDQLETNLGNPDLQVEAVARALPRAVTARTLGDRQLQIASEPLVAHALHEVVRKDPEMLSDALFPIVGRAVRKAVSAAFAAIMERLSAAMEHTFTVQGLRWRLEARRCKRPLAEVILSHNLLFRVEHVFLLHRKTGLLLASASAASASGSPTAPDPEMVAAMFSVIEGFVRETFPEREPLTQFEVGELVGRIEYGPSSMLVALIRGTAPPSLTSELRDAVERIELSHREQLSGFRGGDTEVFEGCVPVLESCLITRQRERQRSSAARIAIALLVFAMMVLVSVWVSASRRAERLLQDYVAALVSEPGIVVTNATRDGKRMRLSGLRDPLARDPTAVLSARGLDVSRASLQFQPYYAPDPRLLERRLRTTFSPPPTVTLAVDGGTVSVSGVAPREWLQRLRMAAGLVPGVSALDVHAVREQEAIAAIDAAVPRAEQFRFSFRPGSAVVDPRDAPRLDALAQTLKAIADDAPRAGVTVLFELEGHTDQTGEESANQSLSEARADAVKAELLSRGVSSATLSARGAGVLSDDASPDRGRNVRSKVKVTR